MADITTRQVGAANTLEYRLYFEKNGVPVSPFHDIPLFANEEKTIFNMVVEIPRWTNAKLEISKEIAMNPIIQDTKKGKLRYVRNCFPHKGYIWNYGAFPQTWEDPNHSHPETKARGDNDPIDVIEIGEQVAHVGQIKQVKILGVMALLDEGETDWKVIVIDINDPLASKLNDIEDVEKHLPGLIRATNEWFRIYKIPDGKPENVFAFSGEAKNKKYATDVVLETHEAWKQLINGSADKKDIDATNTSVEGSPYKADSVDIPAASPQPAAPIDPSIDKWFFISADKKNDTPREVDGHFSMVRNFYLADVITLMNGICGVQSVLSSMRYLTTNNVRDLYLSMILLPFAMFFDFMDGRVARWRNNSSLLGQELDSLADLISFGVAPAALAYAVGMRTYLDTVALTYFICCGIARLARYNATVALAPKDATGKVHHFEGTPIPTSLALVAWIAYFVKNGLYLDALPGSIVEVAQGWELHPFVMSFVVSGTLMISKTLRIPKP